MTNFVWIIQLILFILVHLKNFVKVSSYYTLYKPDASIRKTQLVITSWVRGLDAQGTDVCRHDLFNLLTRKLNCTTMIVGDDELLGWLGRWDV